MENFVVFSGQEVFSLHPGGESATGMEEPRHAKCMISLNIIYGSEKVGRIQHATRLEKQNFYQGDWLECGMEQWNGKCNGMLIVHSELALYNLGWTTYYDSRDSISLKGLYLVLLAYVLV